MDRYLDGEDIATETLIDDLEKAVARGSFYPVIPVCGDHRARPRRAARGAHQRVPDAARARRCRRSPALDGSPRRAADLRPGRPAGGRGGQDHDRPVRRSGLAGPRLLRHAQPGDARCTSPATAWPSAGTPTTTATSASRTSTRRSARSCARCPRASPATSAPSPSRPRAETGDTISAKDRAAADRAVEHAGAAAAGRDRGEDPLRRGRAGQEPGPARRRRPDDAAGAQPGDAPAGAVVHGRGARRRRAGAAARRRRRARHRAGAGVAARDVRRRRPRATAGT